MVFNYCIWCVLFSVAVTVLSLCCLSPVLLPYVAFRGHVACLNFNLTGASEVECILTDLHQLLGGHWIVFILLMKSTWFQERIMGKSNVQLVLKLLEVYILNF